MRKLNWDRNSIAYKLTVFMICLIFGQSVLLIGTLVAGGVLTQVEEKAFQSFYEKVNNRKDYIQREMRNRWTNIDPYVEEISELSAILNNTNSPVQVRNDSFLNDSAPILISMLRTTMATGVFVILNDNQQESDTHTALYFRDYDPMLNDNVNNDLYMIIGSPEISKRFQIPMDRVWKYSLLLDENNRDLYDKPYENSALSNNPSLLGYWSQPFRLSPDDLPIITYTMPLFNASSQVCGVIGIEIAISYFNGFLPATDLLAQDSLGYLIGVQKNEEDGIRPLVLNGALQERMIRKDEVFSFLSKDENRSIYLLENHNNYDKIYACVEKMGLYYDNTPFEQEQWYLIGMMEQKNLMELVNKIQGILLASFLGSIILGGVAGYFVSYKFTKPIISLAKRVRDDNISSPTSLNKIGLSEIDDLSSAMETAHRNLMEATLKMSQIISLVDVAIGAFEYKKDFPHVFATDQLQQILSIDKQDAAKIYYNKDLFVKRLQDILNKPDPDEEDVYKISDSPAKWVRIKMIINEASTLGVIIDVTEEIQEKNKIKYDRDYDSLTKLYNRGAFEHHVVLQLGSEDLKVAALIMFDLDYLKQINDGYGHKWGDIYIRTTAELLSQFSEKQCFVGRRSGDEFYVFLYNFTSREEVRKLAHSFYKKLEKNKIDFPHGEKRQIMISAGLVWYGEKPRSYDELLQCADLALYQAKNFNKGNLCEYGES